MVSSRIEDYLEEIFAEEIRGRTATVTSLAETLGVTKGTVVSALKRLVGEGLLDHERYGTPSLTESGRERALSIYRRHEHLTFLFTGLLGIPRPKGEEIACTIEHALDGESESRLLLLTDFLAQGMREGADWALALTRRLGDVAALPRPLAMLRSGEEGRVMRLTAEGPLRKKLLEMGFVPGTKVVFLRPAPLGDPLEMELRGSRFSLRRGEAATVWVCPSEGGCFSCAP